MRASTGRIFLQWNFNVKPLGTVGDWYTGCFLPYSHDIQACSKSTTRTRISSSSSLYFKSVWQWLHTESQSEQQQLTEYKCIFHFVHLSRLYFLDPWFPKNRRQHQRFEPFSMESKYSHACNSFVPLCDWEFFSSWTVTVKLKLLLTPRFNWMHLCHVQALMKCQKWSF